MLRKDVQAGLDSLECAVSFNNKQLNFLEDENGASSSSEIKLAQPNIVSSDYETDGN